VWLGGTCIFVLLGPQGVRIYKYLLGSKAALIDIVLTEKGTPCSMTRFFSNSSFLFLERDTFLSSGQIQNIESIRTDIFWSLMIHLVLTVDPQNKSRSVFFLFSLFGHKKCNLLSQISERVYVLANKSKTSVNNYLLQK
jgi:hypothetical protein